MMQQFRNKMREFYNRGLRPLFAVPVHGHKIKNPDTLVWVNFLLVERPPERTGR